MTKRRKFYTRNKQPTPMRLTARDIHILETLHAFDGMMSLCQIDRKCFQGKGGTWPRERLRALYDHHYLNMPDAAHIHKVPLGETVYWLDVEGAKVLAGLHGVAFKDLPWQKIGRWTFIQHDLAVNDFRLDVLAACEQDEQLTLFHWVPESEFLHEQDKVTFTQMSGDKAEKIIRPDGFFTIRRPAVGHPGKMEEFAFLLEVDMATEDNPRFGREKVRPGAAYLQSAAYHNRFGVKYGTYLVVTTSELRMENLMAQTVRDGGAGLFYFTTFDKVTAESVMTQPIWKLAGQKEFISIIPQN